MSASTVAINTNPAVNSSPSLALGSKPNARRRGVVVAEKKSIIEMVGDNRVSEVGGGDEKFSGGKDVSNSIRGEMVLERPKDFMQVKKNLGNSIISPRRNRKVVLKPEKHWWEKGLSSLIWNLLCLLIVLVLAQLTWKAYKADDSAIGRLGISDFEGRIAEVEKFVKKTTKMMQVQVEIVDKKLRNEEEKGALLENEMKKLVDRTEGLDKSLGELMAAGIIPKEDFKRFVDELRSRSPEESGKYWGLDDIRAFAREIVTNEIEKHAADGLGRVDYALASGGGMVVRHSEPYLPGKARSWFSATTGRIGVHNDGQKMLQPSFGEPGQCFPLSGSSGWVEIRLRTAIVPEAITLEHIAKSVSYDRSSAPKDCRVSAWLQKRDSNPSFQPEMFLLKEFTYDLEKSNAQTFDVDSESPGLINMVRFDYKSNHGSPSHTCIYRLRVHGYEPESVAILATQS